MYALINVHYGSKSGNPNNVIPNAMYTGHVWVTVYDDTGNQVNNVGFNPMQGGLYGGLPGIVQTEQDRTDWQSERIPLTPTQYTEFIDFLQMTGANPPMYSPWGGDGENSYNCTTWARKIFDVMGIPLNASTLDFLPNRISESFGPQYPLGNPDSGMPWPGGENVLGTPAKVQEIFKINLNNQSTSITSPGDSETNRNNTEFIIDTGANDHYVEIKSGGTVWDAYLSQKDSPMGFKNWEDFKNAITICNPDTTDFNNIPPGTLFFLPEQLTDGSITYHFPDSTSVNVNTTTGEFYMVVPNFEGGQTIYSRTADGDGGFTFNQIATNSLGDVTLNYSAHQSTLDAPLVPFNSTVNAYDEQQNLQSQTNLQVMLDGNGGTNYIDTISNASGLTRIVFDKDGKATQDAWSQPDGSHGEDVFDGNGHSSGNSYNPDGSHSEYTDDGHGNVTVNLYDPDGKLVGDELRQSDGTYGNDTFKPDGSGFGSAHYSDGTQSSYHNDGNGNNTIDTFNPDGALALHTWGRTDGEHGDDYFYPDGSADGDSYNPDGSHSWYSKDGRGNTETYNYAPDGTLQNDSWKHEDGAHGDDTFLPDGSSTGNAYQSDGSHTQYTNDGSGEIFTNIYNPDGILTGDSWTHSDGSYGTDNFSNNGSESHVTYDVNGGRTVYINDGQGNTETDVYGPDNILTSDNWQHGNGNTDVDIFNPDGSHESQVFRTWDNGYIYSSDTIWHADGSYESLSLEHDTSGNSDTDYITSGADGSYERRRSSDNEAANYHNFTHYKSSPDGSYISIWTSADYQNIYSLTLGRSYDADKGEFRDFDEQTYYGGYSTSEQITRTDGSYKWDAYSSHQDGSFTTTDINVSPDGYLTEIFIDSNGNYLDSSYDPQTNHIIEISYDASSRSLVTRDTVELYGTSYDAKTSTTYGDGGVDFSESYSSWDGTWFYSEYKQNADGSGSTYFNNGTGDGSRTLSFSSSDGSYDNESYNASNGDTHHSEFEASTGECTRSDLVHGDNGAYDSSSYYSHGDGETYSGEYIKYRDGSFTQSEQWSDGSYKNSFYDATSRDDHGSSYDAKTGGSYSYDDAYSPNGSYTKDWYAADGSYGLITYNAETGEQKGNLFYAAAWGYKLEYDYVTYGPGWYENQTSFLYNNGEAFSEDYVHEANGWYRDNQSYSDSDGYAYSHEWGVDANGAFDNYHYPTDDTTPVVLDPGSLPPDTSESISVNTFVDIAVLPPASMNQAVLAQAQPVLDAVGARKTSMDIIVKDGLHAGIYATSSDISQLIQAMAVLTPPKSASSTHFARNYNSLAPILVSARA